LREVKRILLAVDNPTRTGERPRPVVKDVPVERSREPEHRKKTFDEYVSLEKPHVDDDHKAKRARHDDREVLNLKDKEKEKENGTSKNGKATALESGPKKEEDDQYDDAALKEIEKFLASTGGNDSKVVSTDSVAVEKGAGERKNDDSDPDVAVLWEDEEAKAHREAQEAEERRKRRQEIASKYAHAQPVSVPTSPVAAKSAPFSSPQSLGRRRAHTVPETPKSEVAVVDVSTLSTADASNGGSSISMPATVHLAKLALGGGAEDEVVQSGAEEKQPPIVGSAVAAAVRAVLPPKSATPDAVAASGAAASTEQDAERRQLEAEKSALELEERREQRGAAAGYGGGYGAGGRVEFDMFSASPSAIEQLQDGRKGYLGPNGKYGDTGIGGRRALREALLDGEMVGGAEDPHLQSNWDDGEGYYKARVGELIGDRFQILGVVGKGVFSTVLKCVDLRVGDGTTHVAVKMIRNNDTMRKAAEKEKSILLSIAEHDPDNKKFCVRLLTHLEYRNHVALVFEYHSMNLRETLKKFGKDVGINIGAVRMYGRQLFVALKHLMDLRVVHADIKLDNILCSADLKQVSIADSGVSSQCVHTRSNTCHVVTIQVKLCDFGSAFRETDTDNDPTPYLVSRFYRAPEIIMGMPCK
jgi:hypothetical protein